MINMASFRWFLPFLLLALSPSTFLPLHAMPPPPPLHCNQTDCTLYNSYGVWGDRKDCRVRTTFYPTTEEELRLAVANATRAKLKVKVVTKFSHTIPKLACPSTAAAVPPGNSMLISTEKYDSRIVVDVPNLAVTADSGVGLREVIDAVEEAGLSLVAAPYWEGVSVGGVISTGGHGSSWWGKGGAVHDHVIGLSLIVPAKESEGFAKIIRLEPKNPLFNAVKVSLGMLGVISQVCFLFVFNWVHQNGSI
ncbi:L-gulonolactone oxidase 3 [Sarracenia purpurea var. burkii]